jgi:hypothetical protein
MIKDIVVNLEHRIGRDPARDFAITIAETFDAHIVGVTFAYAPDFPGYVTLEIPPDIFAAMIAESEKSRLDRDRTFRGRRQAQPGFRGASPAQDDRGVCTPDPVDACPALRSQRVHAIRAERRGQ